MTERPHGDTQEIVRQLLLSELSIGGQPVLAAQVGAYPGVGTSYSPFYIAIEDEPGQATYFEQAANIDIDVFAPTRSQAKSVAFAIQLVLLRYPWSVGLGSGERYVIDTVICGATPNTMPWDDQSVRRIGAQYTLSLRR